MQSQQQSLSPDIQVVIDLCEIHGMPLWYEGGVFVTYQIKIGSDKTTFDYSKTAKAWRVDAVLNWLDTFKSLGPVCHY
jgi:hypothetical protein